jgi:hypothetical protein
MALTHHKFTQRDREHQDCTACGVVRELVRDGDGHYLHTEYYYPGLGGGKPSRRMPVCARPIPEDFDGRN